MTQAAHAGGQAAALLQLRAAQFTPVGESQSDFKCTVVRPMSTRARMPSRKGSARSSERASRAAAVSRSERARVAKHVVFAGFDEFAQKVITFTRTFTHACEYRQTGVFFGDVVNQLLHDNGLTDTGAADNQHFMRKGLHHRAKIATGKGEAAKHHDEQNNYTDSCEHECACFIPDLRDPLGRMCHRLKNGRERENLRQESRSRSVRRLIRANAA